MKIAMFGIKGIPVPAGAEVVAEQVGSRLAQRGHQVTVYVRPNYSDPKIKTYKGMRLVHLPSIPTKNLDAITHGFLASLAVIASDAEIVHIHATGSSIFALLPRLFGIKTVVQSHGLDWQRAKWGKFAKFYLRLTDYSTVHFPNATTAVSEKMTDHYQRMTPRKVLYIPNGIAKCQKAQPDLIRQYGVEGNDYLFFASRFVPEKGLHYLIEAFERLNTNKKLILAGDGEYNSEYARKLKTYASDKIIFTGFVQGALLQELLSNAYIYILPSEIEGLSTGLLEAMNYGNCVLVSDIQENLEVIEDVGFTFKNRNVDDLEARLRYLLQNEELVKSYKIAAEKHVSKLYDWETTTDMFEKLYKQILAGQPSP